MQPESGLFGNGFHAGPNTTLSPPTTTVVAPRNHPPHVVSARHGLSNVRGLTSTTTPLTRDPAMSPTRQCCATSPWHTNQVPRPPIAVRLCLVYWTNPPIPIA
ncbi:uncharacterized protein LACBIDRAFT_309928 [Laccaria bicolor S238N-H82]|uniref:Predicted protein n=1 Tax=Laccaria bicolor (strain S238N-H82 / ATCC MYA-4686) TaxID=486041 RepID=B0DTD1_LACBS|nr:uncharacterized protein LACBIDRAFT_309928 [Laccaria bicolor S238N-H82]EDR02200.1 predicted protein [Laccaria bicolor S238N-H82]|eukprot:XP_001887145.1 predicted protein [Laccaria bicolor S238N-H82]